MPILPLGRNTNYSPGATPVKGNDLNDLQDCIIAGKHGLLTYSKSFNSSPVANVFVLSGQPLSAGQNFVIPMDGLCVGDTIVAADALVERQLSNPVYRLGLWEAIRFPTNSNNNPANSANSNPASVINQRLTITPAAINGGAGLPVLGTASYFLLVEFISGSSYAFTVNSARWAVVRL